MEAKELGLFIVRLRKENQISVFVAGRINPVVPAVIAVVGVIILIIGIYTLVGLQNSDK